MKFIRNIVHIRRTSSQVFWFSWNGFLVFSESLWLKILVVNQIVQQDMRFFEQLKLCVCVCRADWGSENSLGYL